MHNNSEMSIPELSNLYISLVSKSEKLRSVINISDCFQDLSYFIKSSDFSSCHAALLQSMSFTFSRFVSLSQISSLPSNHTWTNPSTVNSAGIEGLFNAISNYFSISSEIKENAVLNKFFWKNISNIDSSVSCKKFRFRTRPDVMSLHDEIASNYDSEITRHYAIGLNSEDPFIYHKDSYFNNNFESYSSLSSVIISFSNSSFIVASKNQVILCLDGSIYSISRQKESDFNLKLRCKGKDFTYYSIYLLSKYKINDNGEIKKESDKDIFSGFTSVKENENYMLHVRHEKYMEDSPFLIFDGYYINNIGIIDGKVAYLGIDENTYNTQPIIFSGKDHFCKFKLVDPNLIKLEGDFFSPGEIPLQNNGICYSLYLDNNLKENMEKEGFSPYVPIGTKYDLNVFYVDDLNKIINKINSFIPI